MSELAQAIRVSRDGEFRGDARLKREITSLLAPSYVDATALVEREWRTCDTLYEHRDENGDLVAFFMVGWPQPSPHPAAYLGLSATRQDTKNSGIVRELYARFVREAQKWEAAAGQRLRLWYITATPSSCRAAYTVFAEAHPRPDGSYDPALLPELEALRQRLNALPRRDGDHPFLARGVAVGTRYSATEHERIAAIIAKTGFHLLQTLGVDEGNGDRMIYLCRVPAPGASAG